nr:MAG TPA: hypothetical protein [Caudoviricetes sp.]
MKKTGLCLSFFMPKMRRVRQSEQRKRGNVVGFS